jgi:GTP-binding protein
MIPTVAIVGRPNVGKSALFNRLAGRRIAIVHDQPGVTRDRIPADCEIDGRHFTLLDTGGIGAALEDHFAAQIRAEAELAIEAAELILFVVDAQDGLTPVDQEIATLLRRAATRVLLLVNKVDVSQHELKASEFARLGFDRPLLVSAEHGRGFGELKETLLAELPRSAATSGDAEPDGTGNDTVEHVAAPVKIALIGRPNVGKSSLINAILGDQRTIVSDVAGTTRDAIDLPYQRGQRDYVLIDTAGIRRRSKVDTAVELFSVMRSRNSIHRADICLLVIDAEAGITAQDRTVAAEIIGAHKPCIIVLNKFDLYEPRSPTKDRVHHWREVIARELFFLEYAPIVVTSATKEQHLRKVFAAIEGVIEASHRVLNTGELNRVLQRAILAMPPPKDRKSHRRFNLLYASRLKSDRPVPVPVPHVVLMANRPELMNDSYLRYLERAIREHTAYEGLPVRMTVRGKGDSR